jgi:hypothetical protein
VRSARRGRVSSACAPGDLHRRSAQKFAAIKREVMMKRVIEATRAVVRTSVQSHIEPL